MGRPEDTWPEWAKQMARERAEKEDRRQRDIEQEVADRPARRDSSQAVYQQLAG
jgi:hypothetical protein